MLADLTLLLHEMSDALRGRSPGATVAAPLLARTRPTPHAPVIVVTGLASARKTELIDALAKQCAGIAIVSRAERDAASAADVILRVHAETDLEAMVEGRSDDHAAARAADIVVPVDWEPLSRSVVRITEALVAHGVDAGRLGA
jgi:hypothetical protein